MCKAQHLIQQDFIFANAERFAKFAKIKSHENYILHDIGYRCDDPRLNLPCMETKQIFLLKNKR